MPPRQFLVWLILTCLPSIAWSQTFTVGQWSDPIPNMYKSVLYVDEQGRGVAELLDNPYCPKMLQTFSLVRQYGVADSILDNPLCLPFNAYSRSYSFASLSSDQLIVATFDTVEAFIQENGFWKSRDNYATLVTTDYIQNFAASADGLTVAVSQETKLLVLSKVDQTAPWGIVLEVEAGENEYFDYLSIGTYGLSIAITRYSDAPTPSVVVYSRPNRSSPFSSPTVIPSTTSSNRFGYSHHISGPSGEYLTIEDDTMNCIYTLQRNDHGQWKYITTLEDAFVEQLQLFYYQSTALMAYRSDAGHCRNTTKACIKLYYLQNNQWVLIEEIDPKNSGSAESHNSLIGWLGPTKTSPPSLVVNGQGDNGGAIYVIEMALVESDVPVTSPSVEVLATHFADPRVKVTSMNTNDARSPARLVDIEVVSKPTNAVVYRHTLPIDRVAQLKCITNKLTYGVRSRYHSASGTGSWSLETEFTASNPASAVIISTTICSERYDAMNETISVSCSDPVAQLASATLTVPTASPIVQAISCTVQDAELCCNATTATIFTQIDDNFGSGSWHTPVYQCVPLATGEKISLVVYNASRIGVEEEEVVVLHELEARLVEVTIDSTNLGDWTHPECDYVAPPVTAPLPDNFAPSQSPAFAPTQPSEEPPKQPPTPTSSPQQIVPAPTLAPTEQSQIIDSGVNTELAIGLVSGAACALLLVTIGLVVYVKCIAQRNQTRYRAEALDEEVVL